MTSLPGNDSADFEGLEVRTVQPYAATKAYLCPACNNEIPARTAHVVVVPVDEPDLRRHWHSSCWRIEANHRLARTTGAPKKKQEEAKKKQAKKKQAKENQDRKRR